MAVRTLAHISRRVSRPVRRGILAYLDLYTQRRALAQLDDTLLDDIGVSRRDAEAEARRPLWDAPSHWHR